MDTILYVDDEKINLIVFEANFKNDYHVLVASSGQEGIEVLTKHPEISIVFSDMKMPGMNGIEFIEEVKKTRPEISCFILTGYSINSEIKDALDNQLIINYFQKPANFKQVISYISTTVKSL